MKQNQWLQQATTSATYSCNKVGGARKYS